MRMGTETERGYSLQKKLKNQNFQGQVFSFTINISHQVEDAACKLEIEDVELHIFQHQH